MNRFFTSELPPMLQQLFYLIGRKYKNIIEARRITIPQTNLTSLVSTHSISNKAIVERKL